MCPARRAPGARGRVGGRRLREAARRGRGLPRRDRPLTLVPARRTATVAIAACVVVVAAGAMAFAVAAVVDVVGGVGLVGRDFHVATDVVAAVGVSTAVLLGLALVLDRPPGRRRRRVSSPDGESPARRAHEA